MKKVLFIICLLAFASSAIAQIKKMEIVGNYLQVTDTVSGVVEIVRPANLLRPVNTSGQITFVDEKGQRIGRNAYSQSTTVDYNGNLFPSLDDMLTWLYSVTSGHIYDRQYTFNFTSDSSGVSIYGRGKYSVIIEGDFGSGDVAIEASYDNASWVTLNSPTYDSDTLVNVEAAGWLRLSLQNSTDPDLNLSLRKIE